MTPNTLVRVFGATATLVGSDAPNTSIVFLAGRLLRVSNGAIAPVK